MDVVNAWRSMSRVDSTSVSTLKSTRKDPTGITVPYRLLVPRLWYEYGGEDEGDRSSSSRSSSSSSSSSNLSQRYEAFLQPKREEAGTGCSITSGRRRGR